MTRRGPREVGLQPGQRPIIHWHVTDSPAQLAMWHDLWEWLFRESPKTSMPPEATTLGAHDDADLIPDDAEISADGV